MRFFYQNLIDLTGVVFTESSEQTLLPSSYLANEDKDLVWRTGTTTALEWVVFDLGSAKAVTAFIAHNHNLTASDTLIRIQGNASDSWGAPAFSQTITYASTTMAAVFASQSYRYWRFTFTKSAAGETRDVGRIFLGTYSDTNNRPDFDGFEYEADDLSQKTESLNGKVYTDVRSKPRMFRLDFTRIPQSDGLILRSLSAYVGEGKAFFSQVIPSDVILDNLSEYFYGRLKSMPRLKNSGFDADYYFNTKLDIREAL